MNVSTEVKGEQIVLIKKFCVLKIMSKCKSTKKLEKLLK